MLPEDLLAIVEPVVAKMPEYHPDAADINAALDQGVGSCAARAYGAGLLIREVLPNPKLYIVDFGYAPEHGGVFDGENGSYLFMGHAAVRLWVPEQRPLIVESDNQSRMEVRYPEDIHDGYAWMDLNDGYRSYLNIAGMDDVEFDPDEILRFLLKK